MHLLAVCWVMRWGRWFHAVWVDEHGVWWEFYPHDETIGERIDPRLYRFDGKDQKVER